MIFPHYPFQQICLYKLPNKEGLLGFATRLYKANLVKITSYFLFSLDCSILIVYHLIEGAVVQGLGWDSFLLLFANSVPPTAI